VLTFVRLKKRMQVSKVIESRITPLL